MQEQEIIREGMQSPTYRCGVLLWDCLHVIMDLFQWTQRVDAQKPISVYIDNACAQTGVSRFMQLYDAWEYVMF